MSTRHTGPVSSSRITRHASAASFASAGRITVRFGIARIAARCSTGWCVGPSSPTATESWLKIQTPSIFISAESRIGGRM